MAKDGPIYGKYYVSRVDGRDAPGGDKEDSKYYVLDYQHDKFAFEALAFYAKCCETEFPELSSDIRKKLSERLG